MSLDDARPGESDVEPVFSRVSAVRSDARDVDGDFHDDHARGGFSGRSGTPTMKTDVGASGDAREGDGDVQIPVSYTHLTLPTKA